LQLPGDGPLGGLPGMAAPGMADSKNCREQFLTSRSDGPQGGRQGWRTQNADKKRGGLRRPLFCPYSLYFQPIILMNRFLRYPDCLPDNLCLSLGTG